MIYHHDRNNIQGYIFGFVLLFQKVLTFLKIFFLHYSMVSKDNTLFEEKLDLFYNFYSDYFINFTFLNGNVYSFFKM